MNPKTYLAHVVLAHAPKANEELPVSDIIKEHFRKSLSVEAVTQHLRERLVRKRKRESLFEDLASLDRELSMIDATRDQRVSELQGKIQEMKKKFGPKGAA